MPTHPVANTPFCAQCGEEGRPLTPYRYPWTPPKQVTPRFCPSCLPRDWSAWERRMALKAKPWRGLPDLPPEKSFPLRKTPCAPFTPVVSFVWDLPAPQHDAVTDMLRGARQGPPAWWARNGHWQADETIR